MCPWLHDAGSQPGVRFERIRLSHGFFAFKGREVDLSRLKIGVTQPLLDGAHIGASAM